MRNHGDRILSITSDWRASPEIQYGFDLIPVETHLLLLFRLITQQPLALLTELFAAHNLQDIFHHMIKFRPRSVTGTSSNTHLKAAPPNFTNFHQLPTILCLPQYPLSCPWVMAKSMPHLSSISCKKTRYKRCFFMVLMAGDYQLGSSTFRSNEFTAFTFAYLCNQKCYANLDCGL